MLFSECHRDMFEASALLRCCVVELGEGTNHPVTPCRISGSQRLKLIGLLSCSHAIGPFLRQLSYPHINTCVSQMVVLLEDTIEVVKYLFHSVALQTLFLYLF